MISFLTLNSAFKRIGNVDTFCEQLFEFIKMLGINFTGGAAVLFTHGACHSNYFTKLLCTDIGITYDLPQAGGDPWNDFDKVWEISPLKYAPKAKTPTLFIQSDEDYRCWMSGAIQMFNALQQNGVPSRIALFHGETHELSRSGKPKNRISRLTEIGDWFEKYLKA